MKKWEKVRGHFRMRLATVGGLHGAQVVGQPGGISQTAHGDRRHDMEFVPRNPQSLVGLVLVEAGHSVRIQAELAGLQRESHPGGAGIKGRVAVLLAGFLEVAPSQHEHHHRRLTGPELVFGHETSNQLLPLLRRGGIHEKPGLLIVAGRRPARGLKESLDLALRKRIAQKRSRRPSIHKHAVDVPIGRSGVRRLGVHEISFRLPRIYPTRGLNTIGGHFAPRLEVMPIVSSPRAFANEHFRETACMRIVRPARN